MSSDILKVGEALRVIKDANGDECTAYPMLTLLYFGERSDRQTNSITILGSRRLSIRGRMEWKP